MDGDGRKASGDGPRPEHQVGLPGGHGVVTNAGTRGVLAPVVGRGTNARAGKLESCSPPGSGRSARVLLQDARRGARLQSTREFPLGVRRPTKGGSSPGLLRGPVQSILAAMTPRPDRAGGASERRFHVLPIDADAAHATRFRLLESDAEHARVVLRVKPGDRCIGLDGAGRSWPMIVGVADRGGVVCEVAGPESRAAAPGELGASLPFLEVAVAMPRGAHAEGMIDALTQLGVARITPLVVERTNPEARSDAPGRRARWERIAREACKQSGRLWNVQMGPSLSLEDLAARGPAIWICAARDGKSGDLGGLEEGWASADRPLVIVVGPEGGFTSSEEAWLGSRGALGLRLGPHVLRTETAAVAALSVLVARWARP